MNIAIIYRIMPLYRLGIFNQLCKSKINSFTIYGDDVKINGIETIPFSFSEMSIENGGIRWIKTKNKYYSSSKLLWQSKILLDIIKNKYDCYIFEAEVSNIPYWLFCLMAKLRRKKVILWSHGLKGKDKGIKKIIRKIYFQYLSDQIFVYDNYAKGYMIEEGFQENEVHVVYNSMLYDKQRIERENINNNQIIITEFKNQLFEKPNVKTFIFIGRIVSEKKVDMIIKVIAELKKNGISMNGIIIGNGPDKKSLEKMVKDYALENNIIFRNETYNEEELCRYFMISDIMISPGNVGLNCVHALTYGIPVITHNDIINQGPEVEAIIENYNGFFFIKDDINSLKQTILKWYEIKVNFRYNCIETIKNIYNPYNQVKIIESAIKNF